MSDAAPNQTTKVRGEKMSSIAHLVFGAALLVASVIVIMLSRSYDLSKNLDFVSIYKFEKATKDKSGAVDAVRKVIAKHPWLNDAADTDGCLNMVSYLWPTAGFGAGSTAPSGSPIAAGTCEFIINLKQGPMEEQLQIKNVTIIRNTGCASKVGTWNVVITPQAGSGAVVTGTPTIQITNVGDIIPDTTTVIGWAFKSFNAKWQSCLYNRQNLTKDIHAAVECQHGFSSPACTCVRGFTGRVSAWQSKLSAKPAGRYALGEVLVRGAERCLDLRRTHDVREAISNQYSRSSALLVFAVALLMNALLNVLRCYDMLPPNYTWWNVAFFVLYFVAVLLTAILVGKDGGMAEFETALAIALPAFLVHATYMVFLDVSFSMNTGIDRFTEPFLHPVTFDVCLCAISLFTLVERGVVQLEYLVADACKCHAVAAIYIAVIWYHKYGNDQAPLQSEFVQQSYLALFATGLVLAGSGLLVPYPAKECFEFHWLLPLIFTFVALLNPGWAHDLRMENKLRGAIVRNLNSIAGFIFLLLGSILLGYFLSEHIQIYGAKNFKYPIQADPQEFVAQRQMVLPGAITKIVL